MEMKEQQFLYMVVQWESTGHTEHWFLLISQINIILQIFYDPIFQPGSIRESVYT